MITKMTRNRLIASAALAMLAPAMALADGAHQPKVLMVMMDGVRGDVVENAPMPNLLALREGRWRAGYNGFSTLTAHTRYAQGQIRRLAKLARASRRGEARNEGAVHLLVERRHRTLAASERPESSSPDCLRRQLADDAGLVRGVRLDRAEDHGGHLYWIAEDASALALKTGFPFWIGQDGTGKCKVSLKGDVDDFALWTRALTREDVRRIHEEGRRGHALGTMLNLSEKVSTCK